MSEFRFKIEEVDRIEHIKSIDKNRVVYQSGQTAAERLIIIDSYRVFFSGLVPITSIECDCEPIITNNEVIIQSKKLERVHKSIFKK